MLDTGELTPGRNRLFQNIPQIGPLRRPMMTIAGSFAPSTSAFSREPCWRRLRSFRSSAMVPATSRDFAWVGIFASHFGGETRFGFSKVFMLDAAHPSVEPAIERLFYFDSNLLILPLGDTRWRPFYRSAAELADVMISGNFGAVLHPRHFKLPLRRRHQVSPWAPGGVSRRHPRQPHLLRQRRLRSV